MPGSVADNIPWEGGCAFAPRCSSEVEACRERTPDLVLDHEVNDHEVNDHEVNDHEVNDHRLLRCHHPLSARTETEEDR